MATQYLYSRNNNLGIYIEDEELDDIMDQQIKDCRDPTSENIEPIVYTKEIDEIIIPDDPDLHEITQFISDCIDSEDTSVLPQSMPAFKYIGSFNSGEEVVVKEGYIPLVRRIQDLERAGEQLRAYRESIYDGHDVGQDMELSPLAMRNLDLTDVDEAIKESKSAVSRARDKTAKADANNQTNVNQNDQQNTNPDTKSGDSTGTV